jgi:hypothetical protein
MAYTVSADVGSLINTEAIETAIIDYAYDDVVAANLFRFKSIVGMGTASVSFPREVKGTAPGSVATEATALTASNVTFTDTVVTVTRYGILKGISTTAEEDNELGEGIFSQTFIQSFARLYGELMDTLAMAQFANATASVGVTATDLTLQVMASAIASQRVLKAHRSKLAFVLHDFGLKQLQAAQLTSTATAWAQFWQPSGNQSSYGGTFFGADVLSNGLAPTANASADRLGCLFPVGSIAGGNDAYAPFAMVVKRAPTSEADKSIADDSKLLASYFRFGVGTIAGNFATKILQKNA